MELRLDRIAYMTDAAQLIHFRVDLHQIQTHTHKRELKADKSDLGTEQKKQPR